MNYSLAPGPLGLTSIPVVYFHHRPLPLPIGVGVEEGSEPQVQRGYERSQNVDERGSQTFQ